MPWQLENLLEISDSGLLHGSGALGEDVEEEVQLRFLHRVFADV